MCLSICLCKQYRSSYRKCSIKRGSHLKFNVIRELKKNVLTFCLHKVLIKCHASISKSSIWFYIDSSGHGVKVGLGPRDLGLRDTGTRDRGPP